MWVLSAVTGVILMIVLLSTHERLRRHPRESSSEAARLAVFVS
jgi:hypothetical protein